MGRRRKKKVTFGDLVREQARAENAMVEAPCPVADCCGGCTLQDVEYTRQLLAKKALIEELFAKEGLDVPDLPPVIGSPRVFGYRNHMEFSFAARRWLTPQEISTGETIERGFALGLHAPGGFDRVLDLERCEIQTETANSILQTTSRIARTSERPAWNPRDHTGFWRFLIVRHALGTDSYLAHLVVSEDDRPRLDEWAEALVAAHPEVTSVSAGISNRVADTSEGAELVHLRGETGLIERVAGLSFEIAPQAFFQPNSHTAAILFDIVTDFAGLSEGDSVVDLFCGTGTLALGLARAGGRVRGYELSEPAVLCARRNAECNGLAERAQFEVRDLMKQVDSDMMHAEDVVVTDPPRAGMHDRAVRALIAARPRRIVHVGCNPKTQARDLAVLVRDGGYRIGRAVAVDQFPHTAHVECVVRLDQRP